MEPCSLHVVVVSASWLRVLRCDVSWLGWNPRLRNFNSFVPFDVIVVNSYVDC